MRVIGQRQWVVVLAGLFCLAGQSTRAADLGALFFGDWGQGNTAQKQVAQAMGTHCERERCDFVIALGDNFYPTGVQSTSDPLWKKYWSNVYGFLGLDFYAALGNHDYLGNPQAQVDYSAQDPKWKMPARYYSFTQGSVAFFAIDTEKWNTTQGQWLRTALGRSRAEWKIVYGHHPILSGGAHGPTKKLVSGLLPILKDKAVDVYLSGHDHDLQVLKSENTPLLVVSGAAAETRPVTKRKETLFARSELGFGYLALEAETLQIRLLDRKLNPLFETTLKH